MIDFRDIRSYSDMERFLAAFARLEESQRDMIVVEMVGLIEQHRASESRSDLFKDQGIKKVATSRKSASKRAYRPRHA